ncbi:putative uncharacterized protein DDB_G0280071 [Leptopilina heterotoma]|uniref:putative uncharacterized protein DDB_G0280071 n=1 Tax=Leptopilina heterotoma TaxID=63436 RepID=UPI001CA9FEF2|nr:putative uncharacterized protein DDB_G0280071 [Leptopilina heterotoma]
MRKIYLYRYILIQIFIFLIQTYPSSSFPKNTNSTLSKLKSLFNNKENDKQSHLNVLAENINKKLRRCKREFHNQNNSNKKSLRKRETNYRTIFENDDIEIQEKEEEEDNEEELKQEETESENQNRFKRNEKNSKGIFKKRKTIQYLTNKEKNSKNHKNRQTLQNTGAILKNETQFSNEIRKNKTNGMKEMKKVEFFVKENESENDFESRVARQISERIDGIKEEIKRQVDERNKIDDIMENNYMFDELQRQLYECQDFSNAKLIKRRSFRKLDRNSRNSAKKRKRKRCLAHKKLRRNK